MYKEQDRAEQVGRAHPSSTIPSMLTRGLHKRGNFVGYMQMYIFCERVEQLFIQLNCTEKHI